MISVDDNEIMQGITERLPSPNTLRLFASYRAAGLDWEDIEDRALGVVDDLSKSNMPMASEAEQYVRRLLIAGVAAETRGRMN